MTDRCACSTGHAATQSLRQNVSNMRDGSPDALTSWLGNAGRSSGRRVKAEGDFLTTGTHCCLSQQTLLPDGVPQQGKRATDSVTHIQRHPWCWHAHLTVTSEERGDAHFGEPCSWWQTAEVKHLAKLGATRGAQHTCELAHRWS